MKTVLVVESEQSVRSRLMPWLNERGWRVLDAPDPHRAVALAREHLPELILCDWPSLSGQGLSLCRQLDVQSDAAGPRPVIIATGAGNGAERFSALECGVDEYLPKPLNYHLLDQFLASVAGPGQGHSIHKSNGAADPEGGTRLKFWGVRGSIAAPGTDTVHYGGNTSCVEVRVNNVIIVLDAGTGLRKLGLSLIREFRDQPIHLNLLITHTHWDHIQGFPFFAPVYLKTMRIHVYGRQANDNKTYQLLSGQMSSEYFPVSFKDIGTGIVADYLENGQREIGGVRVSSFALNHPGGCHGYSFEADGRKIVYATDNELEIEPGDAFPDLEDSGPLRQVPAALVEVAQDADLLIMDAQYDEKEYAAKKKWGHSCCFSVTDLAARARVKTLALFHHDPESTDRAIDDKVQACRQRAGRHGAAMVICAAREGVEFKF